MKKTRTKQFLMMFLGASFFLFSFLSVFGLDIYQSVTAHNRGLSQYIINHTVQIRNEEKLISVLSFNVRGLPNESYLTCTNLKQIGVSLSEMRKQGTAPHVVAIQEGFHGRIKELIEASGYPYVQEGPTGMKGQVTSGLWILSEFPVVFNASEIYRKCASWDCLSNKGVQMAVLHIPHRNIQIELYNTHMNVDKPNFGDVFTSAEKTHVVKVDQINQFHDFFKKHHKVGRYPLLIGDFNFRVGDVFYLHFKKLFKHIETVGELLTGKFVSVDHQFINTNYKMLRPLNIKNVFDDRQYSDHIGILVEYSL